MRFEEYERMYRVEDRHWWFRGLNALVRDSWRAWRGDHGSAAVLDIGCGTGRTMELFGEARLVAGIDVSLEALRWCRNRGLETLARASALALPYRANTFDAVVLLDVLYHRWVTDPAVPLREARRALKPNGLCIVNVAAYQWLMSSHDQAVYTVRRFTRPQIVRLLTDAGFEVISATYWNTLLFPFIAVLRLLSRVLPRAGSDLEVPPSRFVNLVCGTLLRIERSALRCFNFPFGLSLFVVARKTD